MKKEIKVFAPATVGNVSCGFDVLGFALENPGDVVKLTLKDSPGIKITKITGDSGQLPIDPQKNTCGIAAKYFLDKISPSTGVEIELQKKLPLRSGMGSSAAGAAAVLFGLNYLFDDSCSEDDLLSFGLKAEEIGSGSTAGDNIAPSLLGGFVLIQSYHPLRYAKIAVPDELYCCLVHPNIEINTKEARKILPDKIFLKDAIKQWANVGGLVTGLFTANYELIGNSLKDHIVEPYRSKLIPGFNQVLKNAKVAGSLGGGISGSGPSIFTLSKGETTAVKVLSAMAKVYTDLGINCESYLSKVNEQGPRIIK